MSMLVEIMKVENSQAMKFLSTVFNFALNVNGEEDIVTK